MKRNKKTEQGKELLRLYRQYQETWSRRGEHGHFVEVKPYQTGWVRSFTLRQDIANRSDAGKIRRILEKINTEVRCNRKDFLHKKYDTKKWVPIEQHTKGLSEKEFSELTSHEQKYFTRVMSYPKNSKHPFIRYRFRWNWFFVFKIKPLMVTRRWIPDPEWEAYCAEIRNKIQRDNIWPKINNMLGIKHCLDWWNDEWLAHKRGEYLDEDLEIDYVDMEVAS